MKNEAERFHSAWSSPTTARMKSACSVAIMAAWRARGSLNGGNRWLSRMSPMLPSGSAISTLMRLLRFSRGTRSGIGFSHQSTSPFCSAAAAVAASGMMTHSMRSKLTRLPPDSQSAFSSRG